jgi:hypothetical protein
MGCKTLAGKHNLNHKIIKSGTYKNGIYHINGVNSLHSRFKSWLDRFKGISTKHLQNYVTWFKWFEKYKELRHVDKIRELLIHNFCIFKGTNTMKYQTENIKYCSNKKRLETKP